MYSERIRWDDRSVNRETGVITVFRCLVKAAYRAVPLAKFFFPNSPHTYLPVYPALQRQVCLVSEWPSGLRGLIESRSLV